MMTRIVLITLLSLLPAITFGKTMFFMTHISEELVSSCNDPIISSISDILERVDESVLIKISDRHTDCIFDDVDEVIIDGAGDHEIKSKADQVIVSGGFYELCESNTVDDIIRGYFKRFTMSKKDPLNIHIPMNMSFSRKIVYWEDKQTIFTLLDYFRNAYQVQCTDGVLCEEAMTKFVKENTVTLHTKHYIHGKYKFIAYFDGQELYHVGCSKNCKVVKMHFWSDENQMLRYLDLD